MLSKPRLTKAARLLAASATLALAGALPPAALASGPAAQALGAPAAPAVAQVTDATTGQLDASSVAPEPACPAAAPGRATCYAQVLADRTDHRYVRPRLRRPASPFRFAARGTGFGAAASPADQGAGPPQAGTPAYLQQAYDLNYLSQVGGVGDTVAVVDAYDDPDAESDLLTYRSEYGLPACTTANGCFRKVNQTGQQANYPAEDEGWAVEISLDLDAVSALCPNCHIVLVEANSNSYSDLTTAQAEADSLGAQQISDSWGGEQSAPPSGTFTFPGVATVAAAGDDGTVGGGDNQYPAALADVTAAGGTTLTPGSGARGYTEAAWSGTGSGCDATQSKPSWQSDVGCSGRSYDDLSADADPNTGLSIYDSISGGWMVVGGTSEATPLIAAYYAITGASAQTPAWAYQYAASLNDPSTGSNGSCPAQMLYICEAGVGYDGPTGAGSISGAVAAGGPGIGGPGPGGSYAGGESPTTAVLQAGVYPNASATTWWVQYGTSASYGQQTSPLPAGAGSTPAAVTTTLSGLTPGTTYHYRLVAQNDYGTTYGYDYTFTTVPAQVPGLSVPGVQLSGQSATLSALVDPEGMATTYRFQWGTSPSLGQAAGSGSASGTSAVSVAATLSGLAPGTTYYYQLTATSAAGQSASPLLSFTTSPASSGPSGGPPATTGTSATTARPRPAAKIATAGPAAKIATAGPAAKIAKAGPPAGVGIGRLRIAGNRATVRITCTRQSACRVMVRLTLAGRLLADATVTIAPKRAVTVRMRLSRRDAALVRRHPRRARVTVAARTRPPGTAL